MNTDALRAYIDDPGRRADVSVAEITEAFLERIERTQSTVNAFITVTPELARLGAADADRRRQDGKPLPLDGMGIAVKDNIDVAGVRTTVASKFFEDNVATEDSEVVPRLSAAGAVIVGKAFLHEFVFGATCTNPFYGQCRNPWDLDRIPGGSSGGSGAAVAADLCIGALGSDTGGSIRIPAHLNGVSGLRPTFGVISGRGAFPISWSFDTTGPMARSMRDVAAIYEVIAGYDEGDPHSVDRMVPSLEKLDSGIEGLRIGIPKEFFFDGVDPEIEPLVQAAAEQFARLGAEVFEVSVPGSEKANEICTLMIRADAVALHRERIDSQPGLFGEDIRRRLLLGEKITGWEYSLMIERMHEWRRAMDKVFSSGVDLLLTPTANAIAPHVGAEMIETTSQLTRFTYPWSLAHMPACSIPCGFTRQGLPVGVQLAAARFDDARILQAGVAYQEVTEWHKARPPEIRVGADALVAR